MTKAKNRKCRNTICFFYVAIFRKSSGHTSYNWCHSITTSIHLYTRARITMYLTHSPCLLSPLASSPCYPFQSPSLTWNPPSCDRIRPPWSPFACKLTSPFPFPCSYTPDSKIPTPRGFSPPNIHSLGLSCTLRRECVRTLWIRAPYWKEGGWNPIAVTESVS